MAQVSGRKRGKGKEIHINLLQGIPYLEECGCSRLQPWYRDKPEETYTDLQQFVDHVAGCTEY